MSKLWQALKANKKHIILAAVLGALLGLFALLKRSAAALTWYVDNLSGAFKRFLAWLLSFTKYSVAEWLLIAFVLGCAAFIVVGVVRIAKGKGQRLKRLIGFLVKSLNIYLVVAVFMAALWGANYYAYDFKTRAGLEPREYTATELYDTTLWFAQKAAGMSVLIDRDENGLFAHSLDDMFARSAGVFDSVERQYPFLQGRELMPKRVVFSRFMSRANTTGVTFPFTGEANINVDAPNFLIPVTIAHEIAHQRNVASEQEANFVSILACEQSGDYVYQYSGYMLGFIYLSNALYRESPELYAQIIETLPRDVLLDLIARSEYWQRFEGKISDISNDLYDDFLKDHGQVLGTKSYGAVVDLLILYYLPAR